MSKGNKHKTYFTFEELCRSRVANTAGICNYPRTKQVENNIFYLINNLLDPLRLIYDGPITVTSGFRCKELNKKVGGAETSQHLLGQAADIIPSKNGYPVKYEDVEELFELVKQLEFDQAILEIHINSNTNTTFWLHVSIVPAGQGKNRRQCIKNLIASKSRGSKAQHEELRKKYPYESYFLPPLDLQVTESKADKVDK